MVFLGFTLVMPFLPFYVRSLGVEDPAAVALWSGVLLTVTPLLAALLGPFWGRLAHRVGMKIMVQRILLALTLHWGLMFFVRSLWQMLALRILLGLFSGFGTMSVALVTHGAPRDRIGRVVGVLQATQILSTALGPLIGGVLAQAIGIREVFLGAFALCGTAFVFVMALYSDAVPAVRPTGAATDAGAEVVLAPEGPVSAAPRALIPGGEAPAPRSAPSFRALLALPMFAHLLPQLFLVNLVDRMLFLVVPLFVAGFALPARAEALTGAVVSAGALASAASAWALGRRAGRAAPLALLRASLAASAAALLPMAFCRSIAPFALLRVLLGLAAGGAMTLGYTLGGHLLPPETRIAGYSLLSSTAMLGGALGPILCGVLASIDLRAPIWIGAAVYLSLTLHATALSRRTAPAAAAHDAAAYLKDGSS